MLPAFLIEALAASGVSIWIIVGLFLLALFMGLLRSKPFVFVLAGAVFLFIFRNDLFIGIIFAALMFIMYMATKKK